MVQTPSQWTTLTEMLMVARNKLLIVQSNFASGVSWQRTQEMLRHANRLNKLVQKAMACSNVLQGCIMKCYAKNYEELVSPQLPYTSIPYIINLIKMCNGVPWQWLDRGWKAPGKQCFPPTPLAALNTFLWVITLHLQKQGSSHLSGSWHLSEATLYHLSTPMTQHFAIIIQFILRPPWHRSWVPHLSFLVFVTMMPFLAQKFLLIWVLFIYGLGLMI